MSRAKRRKLEKEASKQSAEIQVENPWEGRRLLIIISAVFILLVFAIIGINHYFSEDQKYYRIDIIEVDDHVVDMDYFVRRCYATGSDPMSALTGMTQELILLKEAEGAGLEITEQQIQDSMIEMAKGTNETISQSEFKEWFKQRLNETRLSEDEYKDIVRVQLINEAFYDVISKTMPTAVEQIHLHDIVVPTEEEALEVIARFEAGEAFADLAMELSMDATTREQGGDAGWVPRSIIYDGRYDTVIFDELEIGAISEPLAYYQTSTAGTSEQTYVQYFLFMVTEKSASREVDEQYLTDLKTDAFDTWIGLKMAEHDVHYHGIKNGFDSETYSWINWQLQKLTGEDDE
ncbi:MAG: peptidylprolyl isomerase [Dehalococcoidales bacterium]|nr:peptidylprolyl isomerase [Dehalococcoidales bacterium]